MPEGNPAVPTPSAWPLRKRLHPDNAKAKLVRSSRWEAFSRRALPGGPLRFGPGLAAQQSYGEIVKSTILKFDRSHRTLPLHHPPPPRLLSHHHRNTPPTASSGPRPSASNIGNRASTTPISDCVVPRSIPLTSALIACLLQARRSHGPFLCSFLFPFRFLRNLGGKWNSNSTQIPRPATQLYLRLHPALSLSCGIPVKLTLFFPFLE